MAADMQGKVVMVAAGSKGLGFGIAQACAQAGASVSIASRNADNVAAALEKLAVVETAVHHGTTVDVRDKATIQAWTADVQAQFGRVDGLVINAGGPPSGRFADFQEADWYDAFELTLLSAVRMIHAVLPIMRQQQQGSILTITSSSVKEPIESIFLSGVMRAGVVNLVKALAREIADTGVRVNNLIPGTIYTERVQSLNRYRARQNNLSAEAARAQGEAAIPMGRYGTPAEFGAAGAFLLSDAASYITGATLVVDGGLTRTVW